MMKKMEGNFVSVTYINTEITQKIRCMLKTKRTY